MSIFLDYSYFDEDYRAISALLYFICIVTAVACICMDSTLPVLKEYYHQAVSELMVIIIYNHYHVLNPR